MRTFITVGSFVLQPVVWLVVLRLWLTSRARIKHERHDFGSAVYSDHYELRHLLTQGIGLGLGLAVLNLCVGFSLPLVWIVIYEILTLITLIILPTTVLPLTLIVVSTGLTLVAKAYITQWPDLQPTGLSWHLVGNQNFFWLVLMVFLLLGHWLANYGGRFNSPRIYAKQRGKRIAGYPWREFLAIPMVTLVPGDWFSSHWAFWPVFNIQGHSFAILIIPLILGLRFTVFRQIPQAVYRRLGKRMLPLAGLAIIGLAWMYFRPQDLIIGLVVLLVGYGLILWQAKRYDARQPFWYSQVDNGVRVLAIRPQTPAVKLELAPGDIILECNQQPVTSETSFYEALLRNPTYCHLRVRDVAGELKVTETAIYSGAPHEIGIVLFRDQEG